MENSPETNQGSSSYPPTEHSKPSGYNEQPTAPPTYQQLHTYDTISGPQPQSEYIYTVPAAGQTDPTAVQQAHNVQVVKAGPVQPMIVHQPQAGGPPSDYLVLSIFTAILCFWPLGIAAIVFSVKTRSANKSQDYEKARQNSSYTKIFNGISIAIGIFFWIIVLVAQLAWIVPLAIILSAFNRFN